MSFDLALITLKRINDVDRVNKMSLAYLTVNQKDSRVAASKLSKIFIPLPRGPHFLIGVAKVYHSIIPAKYF